MERKILSGIMLTLLLIGVLTMAVKIERVGAPCPSCVCDVDGNGLVNVIDLIRVMLHLGPQWGWTIYDIGSPGACGIQDGTVNLFDIIFVYLSFGHC